MAIFTLTTTYQDKNHLINLPTQTHANNLYKKAAANIAVYKLLLMWFLLTNIYQLKLESHQLFGQFYKVMLFYIEKLSIFKMLKHSVTDITNSQNGKP